MGTRKVKKRKCNNCKETVLVEEGVFFDYFTKDGEIKSRFYCNNKCLDEKENAKILRQECYELAEQVLDTKIGGNIYFHKMFNPLIEYYGLKVLKETIKEEGFYIKSNLIDKDFVTIESKMKYFFAIIQSKVTIYKSKEKRKEKEEIINNKVVEEIEINDNKNNTIKRSIEDILNSL